MSYRCLTTSTALYDSLKLHFDANYQYMVTASLHSNALNYCYKTPTIPKIMSFI